MQLARRDVDKVATEVSELLQDYMQLKESHTKDILSQASSLQLETLTSRLESMDIYHKLDELFHNSSQTDNIIKEKLEKFMNENSEELKQEKRQKEQQQLSEFMDSKIQNAFEKLRNDNLYIWKESISLAEKEFS